MKILITSGGTKIPIDRVCSITNMSYGTFGSRIADAFFDEGLAAFRTGNERGNPIEKITFFMAKGSGTENCSILRRILSQKTLFMWYNFLKEK